MTLDWTCEVFPDNTKTVRKWAASNNFSSPSSENTLNRCRFMAVSCLVWQNWLPAVFLLVTLAVPAVQRPVQLLWIPATKAGSRLTGTIFLRCLPRTHPPLWPGLRSDEQAYIRVYLQLCIHPISPLKRNRLGRNMLQILGVQHMLSKV